MPPAIAVLVKVNKVRTTNDCIKTFLKPIKFIVYKFLITKNMGVHKILMILYRREISVGKVEKCKIRNNT